MKFLHIGDLHLGRSLARFDLIDDQRFILRQIVQIAVDQKVDAVLIAGDVYDKTTPSEDAVKLLNDFLCELVNKKIRIYVISGNHDSSERLAFGSKLLENSNLFISAKYEDGFKCFQVEDEFGVVNVHLLPFMRISTIKSHFEAEKDRIKSYDDAAKILVEHMNLNKNERNVLLAHQFVTGAKDPKTAGSEIVHNVTLGTVEKIYADTFRDFDYVALGHIHFAQQVGDGEVWYCGSPLKYSLSEADHKKCVLLVSVGDKKADGEKFIQTEQIALKPKRDLRHITGRLEDLLAKDNVTDVEDYIYATLTDDKLKDNYLGIMQKTYPYTVKVDFESPDEENGEDYVPAESEGHKSFRELVGDYFQKLSGRDVSQEEWEILLDVAKEINAGKKFSIELGEETEEVPDETN